MKLNRSGKEAGRKTWNGIDMEKKMGLWNDKKKWNRGLEEKLDMEWSGKRLKERARCVERNRIALKKVLEGMGDME